MDDFLIEIDDNHYAFSALLAATLASSDPINESSVALSAANSAAEKQRQALEALLLNEQEAAASASLDHLISNADIYNALLRRVRNQITVTLLDHVPTSNRIKPLKDRLQQQASAAAASENAEMINQIKTSLAAMAYIRLAFENAEVEPQLSEQTLAERINNQITGSIEKLDNFFSNPHE